MHMDTMKYVESHVPSQGHMYKFTGKCGCGEKQAISVKGPDLFMFRQGKHIQDAFPYLTADDREFLMNGICKNCWDKLFMED